MRNHAEQRLHHIPHLPDTDRIRTGLKKAAIITAGAAGLSSIVFSGLKEGNDLRNINPNIATTTPADRRNDHPKDIAPAQTLFDSHVGLPTSPRIGTPEIRLPDTIPASGEVLVEIFRSQLA